MGREVLVVESLSTRLARLRRDYSAAGLTETQLDPDPVRQFTCWFDEAVETGITEPNAMTLATASPDGTPSARTVLLKGYDERGFVFFTNYESRKGHDLAAHPCAALVMFWEPLHRQVRIEGAIERVDGAASDAYFASRGILVKRIWNHQLARAADRENMISNLWRLLQERAPHPGNVAPPPYRREPDRPSP